MAEKKATEEKKSNGKGKFFLGAALGAIAGAVAGHFVSKNVEISEEECDCGEDCKCKNCDCKEKEEKKEKKEDKKESKK